MTIKEKDRAYIAQTYTRQDVALVRGNGSELYDDQGRRFIDFGGGIAVSTFGAADSEWVAAVTRQLMLLPHTSNIYYSAPCTEVAERLCTRTGMREVFFGNSGAEANECVIKAARKYSSDKYGTGRHTVVTLKNSFHGRTMATLAATGQDAMHNHFHPFPEGFIHITANDRTELDALRNDPTVCMLLLEVIQGEGGVNVLQPEYIRAAADYCKEKDVLLAFDEVQTGNGRTGKLFAYMHSGVTPDLISTAKGLAGGLPFGAALFGEKTAGVLSAGTHGSTFGGNPICAAAACNVLDRLDDALLAGVLEKEQRIRNALDGVPGIIGMSGMGLMLGIETVKSPSEIIPRCIENGLLVLTAKNKLRLLPALNIPDALLDEGLAILKEALLA